MSCTRIFLALLGMLLLLATVACGTGTKPSVAASLDETGLHLQATPPAAIASLSLTRPDGTPVQEWNDLPESSQAIQLPVALTPGAQYHVVVIFAGNRGQQSLDLAAPKASSTPIEVSLQLIGSESEIPLVPPSDPGPSLDLPVGINQVFLHVTLKQATPGTVSLMLPDNLMSDTTGARSVVKKITLNLPSERYSETLPIRVRPEGGTLNMVVQFEPDTGVGMREWTIAVPLVPLDPERLARLIKPSGLTYPATPPGAPPSPLASGTILLPNAFWNKVAHAMGLPIQIHSADAPIGSSVLLIENGTDQPVTLAVSGTVYEPGSDTRAESFAPASWRAAGNDGPQVSVLTTLKPGVNRCELPLYVRPGVIPGSYDLRVTGTILGRSEPLFTIGMPLQVRQTSRAVAATLCLATVLSLISLAVLMRTYPTLIASFTPRQLMTLATLGALLTGGGFLTATLNLILATVLGPLNVFVGEFLTEYWAAFCTLLIVLLLPRPGAFTFTYLVSYLLRALLAGQLQIADILIVGSTIGITESLLWLVGATRWHDPDRWWRTRSWLAGGLVALALGIAGASLTWLQLSTAMGLYRLMYSPWYLVATVAITGFCFTFLGTMLALPLSLELRRIHA
ncbi:MAG: hypothetical protein ABI743_03490 [bacterium]